jgi:hypothetical protein
MENKLRSSIKNDNSAIPFLRWLTKFETKIIRKLMIFPHSPYLSNYVLGLWIMVCGEFRSFGISKDSSIQVKANYTNEVKVWNEDIPSLFTHSHIQRKYISLVVSRWA